MADRTSVLAAKEERLAAALLELGRVVVAFSGGADSAYLAHAATSVLGRDEAVCVTAVSPSLAPDELADCRALATEWTLRWQTVETRELEDPAYRVNDATRCYHCKATLLDALGPIATAEGATVVLGVNLDDLDDYRPGQRAAVERGAVFPLVEAGMTKADVREASRRCALRTWDKPAAACLSSRIPYGTPVDFAVLRSVAQAESGLRKLGFRQLRVRHYGDLARIELEEADLPTALAHRREMVRVVQEAGYRYVTLDLEGFRSGNLNDGSERRR